MDNFKGTALNLSQEEIDAIKVLAKHNKIVYVNKNAVGIGVLHLNNSIVTNLTTVELKAYTNTDIPKIMEITLGINPIHFRDCKGE